MANETTVYEVVTRYRSEGQPGVPGGAAGGGSGGGLPVGVGFQPRLPGGAGGTAMPGTGGTVILPTGGLPAGPGFQPRSPVQTTAPQLAAGYDGFDALMGRRPAGPAPAPRPRSPFLASFGSTLGKSWSGASIGASAAGFLSPGMLAGGAALTAGVGAAAMGYAAFQAFKNLNEEIDRSTQLAAQFNIAFKFDADPARNFAISMGRARKLTGEIIADAARLPGTSSEFFQTTGLIAGPMFSAGKGDQDVRRMTAQIALAAPFAAQRQEDAARQAFRIMTGQVSIGDNPLFAQLRGAGLLPDAGVLNKMTAPKRLDELDKALGRLVNNPIFRERVTNTFETQTSTMYDLLFGAKGAAGGGFKSIYEDSLKWIRDVNDTLAKNMPTIRGAVQLFSDTVGQFTLSMLKISTSFVGLDSDWLAQYGERRSVVELRDKALEATGVKFGGASRGLFGEYVAKDVSERELLGYLGGRVKAKGYDATLSALEAAIMQPELERMKGTELTNKSPALYFVDVFKKTMDRAFENMEKAEVKPPAKITQINNIRVDLKSDTSPQGLAVKMGKAMEQAERTRGRSRRLLPIGPGMGSIG